MPRPKAKLPEYKYHVSGQARVWLDGDWRYLGEYDSADSRAKYYALLQIYEANGQRLPGETTTRFDDAPVTVRCVTAAYREILDARHRGSHRGRFKNLCTLLEDEYGDVAVDDFGPRKLSALRDLFIANGDKRKTINEQVGSIVRVFKHAVAMELIGAERIVALQSLPSLRPGQSPAKESKNREPVPLGDVTAILPHLSPQAAAMVQLQLLTGARPSEIFKLTPSQIDRSDSVWIYHLDDHKTAHHGKQRIIPLVAESQTVLAPFLLRGKTEPCFSPAESAQWHRDQRTAKRKTKHKQGNAVGTNRKANPKRTAGKMFTKDSYSRAVVRACEKAGVNRFTPYRLRHTAATEARRIGGLDGAQVLLGHSNAATTQIYAKPNHAEAISTAKLAARELFLKISV